MTANVPKSSVKFAPEIAIRQIFLIKIVHETLLPIFSRKKQRACGMHLSVRCVAILKTHVSKVNQAELKPVHSNPYRRCFKLQSSEFQAPQSCVPLTNLEGITADIVQSVLLNMSMCRHQSQLALCANRFNAFQANRSQRHFGWRTPAQRDDAVYLKASCFHKEYSIARLIRF